jgi:hypothetical protein
LDELAEIKKRQSLRRKFTLYYPEETFVVEGDAYRMNEKCGFEVGDYNLKVADTILVTWFCRKFPERFTAEFVNLPKA